MVPTLAAHTQAPHLISARNRRRHPWSILLGFSTFTATSSLPLLLLFASTKNTVPYVPYPRTRLLFMTCASRAGTWLHSSPAWLQGHTQLTAMPSPSASPTAHFATGAGRRDPCLEWLHFVGLHSWPRFLFLVIFQSHDPAWPLRQSGFGLQTLPTRISAPASPVCGSHLARDVEHYRRAAVRCDTGAMLGPRLDLRRTSMSKLGGHLCRKS